MKPIDSLLVIPLKILDPDSSIYCQLIWMCLDVEIIRKNIQSSILKNNTWNNKL